MKLWFDIDLKPYREKKSTLEELTYTIMFYSN